VIYTPRHIAIFFLQDRDKYDVLLLTAQGLGKASEVVDFHWLVSLVLFWIVLYRHLMSQ
jgi:hypothetical protein